MKPGETYARGKYTLLRKLRSSGMAEVWLARQHGTEGFAKDVVIKRILPHLAEDEKLVTMFLDEARIAANLNHSNVVQIFDLGNDAGDYFIAMEYIKGYDIEQIIERLKERYTPFPLEFAIRIAADACLGLAYAHDFTAPDGTQMNVVHRDVSPQNILVSETGVVKLIDFGIAKARTSSSRTQVGHTKGKICYMSPEQMMARDLDRRSDIFSAGVVFYEMICGKKPFDGENLLACFHKLMKEGVAMPRQNRKEIPEELEAITMKAMAKDREERYPTANAFRRELEEYLRSAGIFVGPEHVADFLKWLFVDPEGTQVVLDLPRVAPIQPTKKLKPNRPMPMEEPRTTIDNPFESVSGPHTFDKMPRVNPGTGALVGLQGKTPGFSMMGSEETVLEEYTALSSSHSGRFTSAPLQESNEPTFTGGYAGLPQNNFGSHSAPLMEGMEFGDDDNPYSQRASRRKKSSLPLILMLFFLLIVGGLIGAHFGGFLPSGLSKNNGHSGPKPPPPFRITGVDGGESSAKALLKRSLPQKRSRTVKRRILKPRAIKRKRPVARRAKPIRRRVFKPKVRRRKPPKRRRRDQRPGYLVVDTNIRARFRLDSSLDYIKVPMLTKMKLHSGRHKLHFIWPPNKSKTKWVQVRAGQTREIYVKLK